MAPHPPIAPVLAGETVMGRISVCVLMGASGGAGGPWGEWVPDFGWGGVEGFQEELTPSDGSLARRGSRVHRVGPYFQILSL